MKQILLISLLWFVAVTTNAQTFATLTTEKVGTDVKVTVTLINPTADIHTYQYVRVSPYTVWHSNKSYKWFPFNDENIYCIVRGVQYVAGENVVTLYTVVTQVVNLRQIIQPTQQLISNETKRHN